MLLCLVTAAVVDITTYLGPCSLLNALNCFQSQLASLRFIFIVRVGTHMPVEVRGQPQVAILQLSTLVFETVCLLGLTLTK